MAFLTVEHLSKFATAFAAKIQDLFVRKETGKGLSSNDYTAADKAKVSKIPEKFIVSGSQTTTSSDDGGSNVYTFTNSDGTSSTLTVKNGSKGATGAKGATGSVGAAGTRGSQIFTGTGVTGTSATGTTFSNSGVSSALVNDIYLNTSTGNMYKCTTAGAASVAKWAYVGNIKGPTGAKGDTGEKGDTGATGAAGAKGATGTRGSAWYTGTAITGTSATGTIFSNSGISSALVNDCYLNTSTGNVYKCTTAGAAAAAKWAYAGNIKGSAATVEEATDADIDNIIAGLFSE